MKTLLKSLITFSFLLSVLSCSEVKKQVAIDDLVGKYFGKPSVVLQWSTLNIGIEDQIVDNVEKEVVSIFKDSQDNLYLKFDDGMKIKLTNINMATNGAVFNIPSQVINFNADGKVVTGVIKGLNECFFGESKCDGFFDSENNNLTFSFSGTVKISEEAIEYEVPIVVGYQDFTKLGK